MNKFITIFALTLLFAFSMGIKSKLGIRDGEATEGGIKVG